MSACTRLKCTKRDKIPTKKERDDSKDVIYSIKLTRENVVQTEKKKVFNACFELPKSMVYISVIITNYIFFMM